MEVGLKLGGSCGELDGSLIAGWKLSREAHVGGKCGGSKGGLSQGGWKLMEAGWKLGCWLEAQVGATCVEAEYKLCGGCVAQSWAAVWKLKTIVEERTVYPLVCSGAILV